MGEGEGKGEGGKYPVGGSIEKDGKEEKNVRAMKLSVITRSRVSVLIGCIYSGQIRQMPIVKGQGKKIWQQFLTTCQATMLHFKLKIVARISTRAALCDNMLREDTSSTLRNMLPQLATQAVTTLLNLECDKLQEKVADITWP